MAFFDLMAVADRVIQNTFGDVQLTVIHKINQRADTVAATLLDPPQLEEGLPISTVGTTNIWLWVLIADFQNGPPITGDIGTVVGQYSNGVDVSGKYDLSVVATDGVGGCELKMRKQG